MTQPGDDAFENLNRIAAGNLTLQQNPQLAVALYGAGATPQMAQAVNQFATGMAAYGRLQIAQQTGTQLIFSKAERTALAGIGVDPGPVEFSTTDQLAQIRSQVHGALAPAEDKGWTWGRVLHDVTHNPITDVIGKPINYLSAAISGDVNQTSPESQEAARASGYDPESWYSMIAYQSSGIALGDADQLKGLYEGQNHQMVDDAIRFSNDPETYIANIVDDPTASVESIKARFAQLKSDEFQTLVKQVSGHRASIGSEFARDVNLNPVDNPKLFAAVSIGLDIASSFMIDPFMAAGAIYKGVRATALTIDKMADVGKIARIMDGTQKGIFADRFRNAAQSLIDNAKALRIAAGEGDKPAMAAAYARVRNATPGLEHLLSDFNGVNYAKDVAEDGSLVFGKHDPITEMTGKGSASEYFQSKAGIIRLFAGKAPEEIGMMPGQLSAYGVRQLKANLAGGMAARKVAFDLRKAGEAEKILPVAGIDVVDAATGEVKAASPARTAAMRAREAKLASRARAEAGIAVDPELAGKATFASRQGAVPFLDPVAAYYRTKLLIQRWASSLPKDTEFSTANPNDVKKVYQYAKLYMTSSDANLAAARFAVGDEGVRKAFLSGLQLQVMHAAGISATSAGSDIIKDAAKAYEVEQYGMTVPKFLDPASGLERDAAIWPSQVNETIKLMGFRDLQKYAAKIGLWESTIGRGLNTQLVDNMMGIVRPLWLSTFSNVMRNAGEDLASRMLAGEYGDVMRAKAAGRTALPARTRLTNTLLGQSGWKARAAEMKAAGEEVPKYLFSRATDTALWPIARVGRFYRHLATGTGGERLGLRYIASLDPGELREMAKNFQQSHLLSMVDPAGARETSAIAAAGFHPGRVQFSRNGFSPKDTEGAVGAERLSNALSMAVNGQRSLATAILDHIANPTMVQLRDVIKALKNDPRLPKMIRASIFKDAVNGDRRAVTVVEKEAAIRRLAEDQIGELRYLVSNDEGVVHDGIVSHIRDTGVAPSTDWIMDNIPEGDRAVKVLAPDWVAKPIKPGVASWVGAVADLTGQGYKWMVERPIARISSMPIFLSNYGKMRAFMEGWEETLVKGGMSKEAADNAARNIAMNMSWHRTLQSIDDPTVRTQMDLVGRNFFAFSRATQAFIRRWGRQFVENPERLRRLMLANEAAHKAGLIYKDAQGNDQFVFPGSGVAIQALMKAADALPGVDFPGVPGAIPNLTGRVAFLSPGLQNPFQMSLTPMVNIPFRAVASMNPSHRIGFDQIDAFFNGTQGAGASVASEFTPAAFKKFADAFNDDDRNSMTSDTVRTSILNLEAAGLTPGAGADAAQRAEYLSNIRIQSRNTLLMRAIFGFFPPAPPGEPTMETEGSKADWFYGAIGVHGLSDEYKKILDETNGDVGLAGQIWAGLHPDKLMYTTPSTTLSTKGAEVAATESAHKWLNGNLGFMKDYKGVAAYFIPADTQTGGFDLDAYHAEMEIGLRQHKSTADYFDDVSLANSSSAYYAGIKARDDAINKYPDFKKNIEAQWTVWKADFDGTNPLFAQRQSDYASGKATATDQLAQLQRMVDNPAGLPASVPVDTIREMVSAYETYHNALAQFPGGTNVATYARANISGQYATWWHQVMDEHPELGGLYAGVFHVLDSNVLDPLGGN